MVAFTKGLKDQDLVKSLHFNPFEDFDDINGRAKHHMMVTKGLQSIDNDVFLLSYMERRQKREVECKRVSKNHDHLPLLQRGISC